MLLSVLAVLAILVLLHNGARNINVMLNLDTSAELTQTLIEDTMTLEYNTIILVIRKDK